LEVVGKELEETRAAFRTAQQNRPAVAVTSSAFPA
jgi:hypothetical protein